MNHDFFSFENLQLAVIGGLSGFLKGLAGQYETGGLWLRGVALATVAGLIATPLFGPTMAVGLHWMVGGIFTPENIWLLAGSMTGILGVGVVSFVLTFVKLLASKAGVENK